MVGDTNQLDVIASSATNVSVREKVEGRVVIETGCFKIVYDKLKPVRKIAALFRRNK